MVSSVSSLSSSQYQPQLNSTTKLTDDQKKKLDEILAKYDSSSMTSESTKTLMDELKSSNIPPCKETREAMDTAGFKPPEKPQGPPPDDSTQSTKNALPQFLLDFIQKEESGSVSQEDINTLIQNLQNSGETTSGSLVDQKV
jgi:hypothetical protein